MADDFYSTANGYRAYHAARGNVVPTSTDDAINAKLLVASEYIDAVYGDGFSGSKTGMRAQVREWPRAGAYDVDGYSIGSDAFIPREIEAAANELAWRLLVDPKILNADYTPGKYKRVSIDGAMSVEYASVSGSSDIQVQIPILDQILASLLSGSGGGYSSLSGRRVLT